MLNFSALIAIVYKTLHIYQLNTKSQNIQLREVLTRTACGWKSFAEKPHLYEPIAEEYS